MDKDLNKLFMQSLLHRTIDMPEPELPPMSAAEEKELLNNFSSPDFPGDVLTYAVIRQRQEPGKVFSKGALSKAFHTIKLFIGGKILSNFYKTQKSPEVVVISVRVEHMTKEEFERDRKQYEGESS
jgi:hypothetical protein